MEEKKPPRGGSRQGAGRPKKIVEENIASLFDLTIDRNEVVRKMRELILKGDARMITLYLAYMFGKPTENVKQDINMTGDVNISLKDMLKFKE